MIRKVSCRPRRGGGASSSGGAGIQPAAGTAPNARDRCLLPRGGRPPQPAAGRGRRGSETPPRQLLAHARRHPRPCRSAPGGYSPDVATSRVAGAVVRLQMGTGPEYRPVLACPRGDPAARSRAAGFAVRLARARAMGGRDHRHGAARAGRSRAPLPLVWAIGTGSPGADGAAATARGSGSRAGRERPRDRRPARHGGTGWPSCWPSRASRAVRRSVPSRRSLCARQAPPSATTWVTRPRRCSLTCRSTRCQCPGGCGRLPPVAGGRGARGGSSRPARPCG
ncbi:hypothetical protein CcI6DRAFT_03036 [Frankia sp. CcI6]|nr:hypothetical protein CcI6DRAFT_03036 [Frankia sp. CcI6]KDA42641.1 hypothetical protein BMG523Draft_02481 [Frankia sp. BMG5.23]OAA22947.1 hypothetical protein AAY23_105819 [Frankia casuarinae]